MKGEVINVIASAGRAKSPIAISSIIAQAIDALT
jgi:hypothetical protein